MTKDEDEGSEESAARRESAAMHLKQAALVVTKRCQAGPGPSVP